MLNLKKLGVDGESTLVPLSRLDDVKQLLLRNEPPNRDEILVAVG